MKKAGGGGGRSPAASANAWGGSQKDVPGASTKEHEQGEVFQDINFLRDLGPLSRKLSLVSKKPKSKEYKDVRALQKKIMNHFVDLEPNQKNLNDEIFLLALSGQVPIDKLLLRLQRLKPHTFDIEGQVDPTEWQLAR